MAVSLESPSLPSLVEEIRQAALEDSSSYRSPESHFRLLKLVDELKLAVETPEETVLRLIYQPPQNAALRTVMDMNIFPLLVQHPKGLSAEDLASSTGADKALIVRLMRVMVALGLAATLEPEVYLSTSKTVALTQPIGRDGIPCLYDLAVPTLARLPEYFRDHHYAMPQEYSRSPMRWAVGDSQFEWLAQRKHRQSLFNSYMSSRRQGRPSWFDVYPVDRLLDDGGHDPHGPFLVDIGGNQGHDLAKFLVKFPEMSGRLVLQDLPKVVSSPAPGIEAMPYSFLDPQPVKGARAYYFRAIFHDWPDYMCHKILVNTVSAMDPESSRLLIVDHVLDDAETSLMQASVDIQMMSIGAGMERSKRQWKELLQGAALEIRGIWKGPPGMESVIEAGVCV